MQSYYPLINKVMTYPWGSHDAIADLLGQACPSEKPQAELWLGAHPKAPSVVERTEEPRQLDQLVQQFPRQILGSDVAAQFGNQLPFLLKVLSAGQPLSIQAHPGAAQARAGFEKENELGIPLGAAERNFSDPNPKPECICALSEFWALCGFRPEAEIATILRQIAPNGLADEAKRLNQPNGQSALPSIFAGLLMRPKTQCRDLISEVLSVADSLDGSAEMSAIRHWILRIADVFPNDIGVLAPALLNLVKLEPGEALFLPAGSLHAYLGGTGIELMGSSDNVLRGGLTAKHIDVEKLIQTISFEAWRPDVLVPIRRDAVESYYPCPVREFQLAVLKVAPGSTFQSQKLRSVEILLCTEGQLQIIPVDGEADSIMVRKGKSLLIPASAPAYQIAGNGVLYRASVPAGQQRPEAPADY